MLPKELDGVTLLVDVPMAKAGEDGVIVGICRAVDGRMLYRIELDGDRTVELDSTQFGLD
jgi:hypothetical protein